MRTLVTAAAVAPLLLLAACSRPEPLPPEVQAAIEVRQQGFSDIGESFKLIRDALQAGRSLDADMVAAAERIHERSTQLEGWFPEGSSSEHSRETDALPGIWTRAEDFNAKREAFVEAAGEFAELARAGDTTDFASHVGTLGQSCKACHDDYRGD